MRCWLHRSAVALPCCLVGFAPDCCYWSVQIFVKPSKAARRADAAARKQAAASGAKPPDADAVAKEQILCDREIMLEADGRYKIALSSKAARPASVANWIDATPGGGTAFIVIRAFKCAPGRAWRAPEIHSLTAAGGVAAAAWPVVFDERTPGPFAMSRAPTGPAERLRPLVAAHGVALALAPALARPLALGAGAATVLYSALRAKVRRSQRATGAAFSHRWQTRRPPSCLDGAKCRAKFAISHVSCSVMTVMP